MKCSENMKKLIKKYQMMSYEEKMVLTTSFTMSISLLIAIGKIIIGIFSDYILCVVGSFTVILCLAKLECLIGIKKDNRDFRKRNTLVSVFLFLAGLLYIIYMAVSLSFSLPSKDYSKWKAISLALISFIELGLAISGLFKTKKKDHFYHDIKIIGFVSSLTAMLTTQVAILSFTQGGGGDPNYLSGIGIGIVTVLLSINIYFAPVTSVIGREKNSFVLTDHTINTKIKLEEENTLVLCKSRIYGNYVYHYSAKEGKTLSGTIKREKGFWKNTPVYLKILFIVLSEILIFAWAIGYFIYFIRTVNMPKKLSKLMKRNGFSKLEDI